MQDKYAHPHVLIQFEDFGNENAIRLLSKYRDRICCFNDDVQGTGAVTLAGVHAVMQHTQQRLRDQTVLFLGAGSAAVGIADVLVNAMVEWEGHEAEAARRRVWLLDSTGLVVASRLSDLPEHKKPYAHDHEFIVRSPIRVGCHARIMRAPMLNIMIVDSHR